MQRTLSSLSHQPLAATGVTSHLNRTVVSCLGRINGVSEGLLVRVEYQGNNRLAKAPDEGYFRHSGGSCTIVRVVFDEASCYVFFASHTASQS
jgi:hypothetical protein